MCIYIVYVCTSQGIHNYSEINFPFSHCPFPFPLHVSLYCCFRPRKTANKRQRHKNLLYDCRKNQTDIKPHIQKKAETHISVVFMLPLYSLFRSTPVCESILPTCMSFIRIMHEESLIFVFRRI